jgi:acetolactate synthase I/II/III large subunit
MSIEPITQNHATETLPTPPRLLKGSQIIWEVLLREGVDTVFGYPGGRVLPMYHALAEYPMRHILVRHEQGAGFGASGYARATGKVGVCVGTSGPGATNLVTSIADAMMDSVPMVAITGQVATNLIGKDAFQEIDATGITLPITKHNWLVTDVADLARTIREAFYVASTGRPGPVLIDIPSDVQLAETEFSWPVEVRMRGYKPTVHGNVRQVRAAAELINSAKKPIIVAGHGVIISRAFDELRALAEKAGLPVITTLHGISSFPESHELSFGMMGMHGSAYANRAVQECDLFIGIGMRFDDRVTGKIAGFAPMAKIIHIDVDPAEIGKNVRTYTPIVGDVKGVLANLIPAVDEMTRPDWVGQISEWRRAVPMTYIRETDEVLPQWVIRQLYEVTGGDATIVADVGQHQMWAAQHFWFDKPNSYITSGGLGSMGFALPAGMGVKVARPDETVWVVVGDGGIQMTMMELGTIAAERIPVKIAVINNGYLGMVRQWQEFFYSKRYSASPITTPDFVKLCEAYGIPAQRVIAKGEVRPAIEAAMAYDGPMLIEFVVAEEENVYPMIPSGGSLSDIIIEPSN